VWEGVGSEAGEKRFRAGARSSIGRGMTSWSHRLRRKPRPPNASGVKGECEETGWPMERYPCADRRAANRRGGVVMSSRVSELACDAEVVGFSRGCLILVMGQTSSSVLIPSGTPKFCAGGGTLPRSWQNGPDPNRMARVLMYDQPCRAVRNAPWSRQMRTKSGEESPRKHAISATPRSPGAALICITRAPRLAESPGGLRSAKAANDNGLRSVREPTYLCAANPM
jgi:hypothetical protein